MKSLQEDLHQRYSLQAKWTKPFRNYLFSKLPVTENLNILEVGCGTGAILTEIQSVFQGSIKLISGMDVYRDSLVFASSKNKGSFIQGDAHLIPFVDSCFDLVYCHYFLLWVQNPIEVFLEMVRVTKKGGICAVMAEPSYDEMEVEPADLQNLALKQKKVLSGKGANINIGNTLYKLFYEAGYSDIEFGRYKELESDQSYLIYEIKQMLLDTKENYFELRSNVNYTYNIPTYYAFAMK